MGLAHSNDEEKQRTLLHHPSERIPLCLALAGHFCRDGSVAEAPGQRHLHGPTGCPVSGTALARSFTPGVPWLLHQTVGASFRGELGDWWLNTRSCDKL